MKAKREPRQGRRGRMAAAVGNPTTRERHVTHSSARQLRRETSTLMSTMRAIWRHMAHTTSILPRLPSITPQLRFSPVFRVSFSLTSRVHTVLYVRLVTAVATLLHPLLVELPSNVQASHFRVDPWSLAYGQLLATRHRRSAVGQLYCRGHRPTWIWLSCTAPTRL